MLGSYSWPRRDLPFIEAVGPVDPLLRPLVGMALIFMHQSTHPFPSPRLVKGGPILLDASPKVWLAQGISTPLAGLWTRPRSCLRPVSFYWR